MNSDEWGAWVQEFLASIDAPDTPQNESFLAAWFGTEGSDRGFNNPLNITKAYLGGSSGQGGTQGNILQFPDVQTSAQNTASFLQHGYTNIVAALKSGNPWNANNSGSLASELGAWSMNGYSGIQSGIGAPLTTGTTTPAAGSSSASSASSSSSSSTPWWDKSLAQNVYDGTLGPQLQQNFQTGLVVAVGVALLFASVLWLALSNSHVQEAAETAGKAALA